MSDFKSTTGRFLNLGVPQSGGSWDLSVLGDRELDRTLGELGPKVEKSLIKKVLPQAFGITLRAVLRAVPVNTGRLKASIKMGPGKSRRGLLQQRIWTGTRAELGIDRVIRRRNRLNDTMQNVQVRGGGYYPIAIEYGYTRGGTRTVREWINEGVDRRGRRFARRRVTRSISGGKRIPPRSYMRVPLRATEPAVYAAMRQGLWDGVLAALGKGAAA